MPQAFTLIRTCPGPGSGISRSTIWKSAPGLEICAIFIFALVIGTTLFVAISPPDSFSHASWFSFVTSPATACNWASGQEHRAHDHTPHQADGGRDEARIDAVRCPKSAAEPGGAAQQDEHDGGDPGREHRVRD